MFGTILCYLLDRTRSEQRNYIKLPIRIIPAASCGSGDHLPWETERPVMLEKRTGSVNSAETDKRYVFNCVLLQDPMCETMMRFGYDIQTSSEYINYICCRSVPLGQSVNKKPYGTAETVPYGFFIFSYDFVMLRTDPRQRENPPSNTGSYIRSDMR